MASMQADRGTQRIQNQLGTSPDEIKKLQAEVTAAASPERRRRLEDDLRQAEQYLAELKGLRPPCRP
jgi:hypothetical protein